MQANNAKLWGEASAAAAEAARLQEAAGTESAAAAALVLEVAKLAMESNQAAAQAKQKVGTCRCPAGLAHLTVALVQRLHEAESMPALVMV